MASWIKNMCFPARQTAAVEHLQPLLPKATPQQTRYFDPRETEQRPSREQRVAQKDTYRADGEVPSGSGPGTQSKGWTIKNPFEFLVVRNRQAARMKELRQKAKVISETPLGKIPLSQLNAQGTGHTKSPSKVPPANGLASVPENTFI
jgi:hypothetical protein